MKQQNNNFAYGAVLKIEREHTREDIREMLIQMRSAGMNTVVVWPSVYWWEKENDHYPYATGRQLLADAGEIGINVIMEMAGQITSLEYVPDFLMKKEYFCVDREGNIDEGSLGYGTLNFNHPEVKKLIHEQYAAAAREYREYPALHGYDIWNETQFTSFDDHTLSLFRLWLREKYGTLDLLNDSWDRVYRSWEDVHFSKWMWASVMPFVDYQEFHKDNIGIILQGMRTAIEAEDNTHKILADNIHASVTMDHYYDRPSDDWTVAQAVDQYGISFYPKFLSSSTPPFLRHQTMTGAHSAATDGRFFISEMQTHHGTMFNPEGSVSPGELWQWCWEAVSHGANGIIYWKWNPFRKGVQTFGRGLVDLAGRTTPRLETAMQFAEVLAKEPGLITAKPHEAVAAILYDRENQDFAKAYTIGFRGMIGAPDSIYLDSIQGLYRTMWEHNVPTAFVTPEDLIEHRVDHIPVLFLTTQVVMRPTLKDALIHYCSQGGTLVADGKLGEVNETGLLYPTIPGEGLSDYFGFELMDMKEGNLTVTLSDGKIVNGKHDRRDIHILSDKVKVIGTYDDGAPAILSTSVGKGRMVYISTFLWYGCKTSETDGPFHWLRSAMEDVLSLPVECSTNSLSIQLLQGADEDYMFVFNYGDAHSAHIVLPDGPYYVRNVFEASNFEKVSALDIVLPVHGVALYSLRRR